jgi:hypothetical protein
MTWILQLQTTLTTRSPAISGLWYWWSETPTNKDKALRRELLIMGLALKMLA